jgi:hypothetical protein
MKGISVQVAFVAFASVRLASHRPTSPGNASTGPKDGREPVGGYPHVPLGDRPKFEPTDMSYAHPPHTPYELHRATQKIGPGAEERCPGPHSFFQ